MTPRCPVCFIVVTPSRGPAGSPGAAPAPPIPFRHGAVDRDLAVGPRGGGGRPQRSGRLARTPTRAAAGGPGSRCHDGVARRGVRARHPRQRPHRRSGQRLPHRPHPGPAGGRRQRRLRARGAGADRADRAVARDARPRHPRRARVRAGRGSGVPAERRAHGAAPAAAAGAGLRPRRPGAARQGRGHGRAADAGVPSVRRVSRPTGAARGRRAASGPWGWAGPVRPSP